MSFLATLATLAALLPQTPPPAAGNTGAPAAQGRNPILTPAEQTALRDKLIKYLDAESDWDRATAIKDREKTARAREKHRKDFEDEWEKLEKKGNLLASTADLRSVFENCFAMKQPSFSTGNLRQASVKDDGVEYSFFLPKSYKADKPMRTVIVLPGAAAGDGAVTWTKPTDWFGAVWDKTNATNDTIFHIVHVPAGLELDPIPEFSREGQEAEEKRRIGAVWSGFGTVMTTINVDRPRVFLDCGRATCGFGLRFATMFPDRFAGVILRHPTDVPDLRLGSLLGMPVLLLKTAATASEVQALKDRLEAATPGTVTVLEATDEYPHKGMAPAIEEWMGKQRRNMTPKKVVIEPNIDLFRQAYWARIDRAEPLVTSGDKKPRLEVEVDRAANRIVVKAVSVDRFELFLNDDLVDLDKEFTVIVNDKAIAETRTRSREKMRERMLRRGDWEYLFPVQFHTNVPKPAAEDGDKNGEKSGEKK